MKTITLPDTFTDKLLAGHPEGRWLMSVNLVDWFPPLTDAQVIENAVAEANGVAVPHPNPNLVAVRVPFPTAKEPQ